MSATATLASPRPISARITAKGQITVPAEIRRLLGAKPGYRLVFEPTPGGLRVIRPIEENSFEKMRGIGNAMPEGYHEREGIVRYFQEMRGHDEADDLLSGVEPSRHSIPTFSWLSGIRTPPSAGVHLLPAKKHSGWVPSASAGQPFLSAWDNPEEPVRSFVIFLREPGFSSTGSSQSLTGSQPVRQTMAMSSAAGRAPVVDRGASWPTSSSVLTPQSGARPFSRWSNIPIRRVSLSSYPDFLAQPLNSPSPAPQSAPESHPPADTPARIPGTLPPNRNPYQKLKP